MKKTTLNVLFWAGWFLLLVPGLVHAYLLMPFPGSQELEVISLVYSLEKCVWPARILGLLLLLPPLRRTIISGSRRERWTRGAVMALTLGLFYFTDVAYKAERMFQEPQTVKFATRAESKVPDSLLVIGVVHDGIAKAYPVNYLGYHHKVQDYVGRMPVLVTYCTMCRSGRVFSPVVNGKPQTFRLVGARHYNAVIEDRGTRTWWYQATGEAAAGPLKGQQLREVPYEQGTLRAWLARYPGSLILQPDAPYQEGYDVLKRYDRLQPVDKDSTLNPDTLIRKSWVVGVTVGKAAKAYDWRKLVATRVVHDQLGGLPLLLAVEADSLSFHAFGRQVDGKALHFERAGDGLHDRETGSAWNWQGVCVSGPLAGKELPRLQAHQEYWHSWQRFHHPTSLWRGDGEAGNLVRQKATP
jgi:hypothetical protein